jgi:hypothetical protein
VTLSGCHKPFLLLSNIWDVVWNSDAVLLECEGMDSMEIEVGGTGHVVLVCSSYFLISKVACFLQAND